MLLKDIGGEFAFLTRIIRPVKDQEVIVPNGDDAAVIRAGGELWAVSTDTIVEHDHFSFAYFRPEQVGAKAIESSCSDIVAMGGAPNFVFISLCVPRDMEVDRLERFYRGVSGALARVGASLLGGDTTHGSEFIVSMTVMGRIADEGSICRRSDARPGDAIFLSGPIGGSLAGLRLFQREIAGYEEVKRRHLEPHCRIDLGQKVAPYAHAMIDISDGLSSEIHHICDQSGCGAVLDEELIPIDPAVHQAAAELGENALDYAYSGGEDFQLLYTLPSDALERASGVRIGSITESRGVFVKRGGELVPLERRGYDHFRE